MKRSLVLSHEEARHPFRRSLPRHIFVWIDPEAAALKPAPEDDKDWKLFLLSFTAFFTVAYTFIV